MYADHTIRPMLVFENAILFERKKKIPEVIVNNTKVKVRTEKRYFRIVIVRLEFMCAVL